MQAQGKADSGNLKMPPLGKTMEETGREQSVEEWREKTMRWSSLTISRKQKAKLISAEEYSDLGKWKSREKVWDACCEELLQDRSSSSSTQAHASLISNL